MLIEILDKNKGFELSFRQGNELYSENKAVKERELRKGKLSQAVGIESLSHRYCRS